MSGDIYVSFGAQTGEFEAAAARMKAELASVVREMRNNANQMVKSGADMDSALGQSLKALGDRAGTLKAGLAGVKDALSSTVSKQTAEAVGEVAGGFNRMQQMETVHVLKAIFDEMAAGQSPMRAVAMEGGRIAQIFSGGGIGAALGPIGMFAAAVTAAGAAVAYLAYQSSIARDITESLKNGMALSGRKNMSESDMGEVSAKLNAMRGMLSGLGAEDANKLAMALRTIPGMTKDMADAAIAVMQPLADALKIKLPEAGKVVVESLASTDDAVKQLTATLGGLDPAWAAELKSAEASLDTHKMQAAILHVYAEALKEVSERKLKDLDAEEALLKAQEARNNKAGKSDEFVLAQIRAIEDERKKIEDANAAALKQPEIIAKSVSSAGDLATRFDEVTKAINGSSNGVDDLQKKLDQLRQGLGFTPSPGGGGVPGSPASADQAAFFSSRGAGDYKDLSGGFAANLQKAIADAEAATGSRASVASGYRSTAEQAAIYAAHQAMPGGLAAHPAAAPGNSLHESGAAVDLSAGPVLDWLHAHIGNYPGLEFLTGQTGANDPGHIQIAGGHAGVEAYRKTSDDLLKANNAAAGGSGVDRAKLAAIEAEAAGKGNELKAQEAIVKATEDELSKTSGLEARTALQTQLAEQRLKRQGLENAAKEAGLKLEMSRVSGTGNIDAEHSAASKLAALKMDAAKRQYGVDSAQYKTALQEKEAADDKYEVQKARIAKSGADEEIKVVHDAANQKRKELEDDLAHHRISASKYLSDAQGISTKELADVKALYDKEIALDGQTADQKRAIATRSADDMRRINDQTADAARKTADATEKAWGKSADAVFGEVNSALKGIVDGNTTVRQAAVSALESIAEAALKTVEKMLVAWAMGAAGKKAIDGTSVMGDAKVAAAGAYAATAGIPLVGPVLAPIAAGAAFSGTMAFGSMDIGAYNIPENQLALVHKNELVMPAAQAGAFRSMLDGAASGGGSGGGDTHAHFHVTAIDSGSVKSFFANNSRHIATALNSAVRNGDHIGLKSLGARG